MRGNPRVAQRLVLRGIGVYRHHGALHTIRIDVCDHERYFRPVQFFGGSASSHFKFSSLKIGIDFINRRPRSSET